MTSTGSDQGHWPEDLQFLWDQSLSAAQLGGLIATRGFYYQYLYSLRLMRQLLAQEYTGYVCEVPEDFTAWTADETGKITRLAFIQVKTSLGSCFLSNSTAVRRVLQQFKNAAAAVGPIDAARAIEFRIVCNAHTGCGPACESATRTRHKRGLRTFEKHLTKVFPNANTTFTLEHFLPIPTTRNDLLQAVAFLDPIEPGLHNFLTGSDSLTTFLQNIIGVLLPYHAGRTGKSLRAAWQTDGFHRSLQHDYGDTIEDLRQALKAAADRAASLRRNATIRERQLHARRRANHELEAARTGSPSRRGGPTIRFPDREHASKALRALFLLRPGSCLFSEGHVQLWHDKDGFRLTSLERAKYTKLDDFIKNSTHVQRVDLIISFLNTIVEWAASGVTLTAFRADQTTQRSLYVTREPVDRAAILLGDLGAVSVREVGTSILEPEWLRATTIAAALRYLYYGVRQSERVKKSPHHQQTWNDNIVEEFTKQLERRGIIRADSLRDELVTLFHDEQAGWPIFFHAVSEQFIQDISDAGFESVAQATASVHPTRMLADRGPGRPTVFYAFSDEAQIGLLRTHALSFTLFRYVPYLTRRWARRRERDRSVSVDLQLSDLGRQRAVFIGIPTSAHAPELVHQTLGKWGSLYAKWLRDVVTQALRRRYDQALPDVLHPEDTLLTARRARVDALSKLELTFELVEATTIQPGTTAILSLTGTHSLSKTLRQLGYSDIDDRSGIAVWANDNAGHRLRGTLRSSTFQRPAEIVQIDVAQIDEGFSNIGTIILSDPGSERVIAGEEVLLRELRYSLSDPLAETPAHRAWQLLEPYLGSDALQPRSTRNLWNGELRIVPTIEHPQDLNALPAAIVASITTPGSSSPVHVITGAPGTGKTRVAAEVAVSYLQTTQDYPPPRVLVISPSHFGIDNFLRTFIDLCPPATHIFRNVPEPRIDRLKNTGVIDGQLLNTIAKHWDEHRSALPALRPRAIDALSFAEYSQGLHHKLASLPIVNNTAPDNNTALFPSHQAWRALYGDGARWFAAHEVRIRESHLRNKIADLQLFKDVEQPARDEAYATSESLYTQFAADVIATTPDAVDRLPDMVFGLVVLEEASQFSTLKLLKVLAKVLRPLTPGQSPCILLSGDPQQLPPFVDAYTTAGEAADADAYVGTTLRVDTGFARTFRAYETPFERICARSPVTPLVLQRRMHPTIATLINTLFYSDQQWYSTRPDGDGGVAWINTHDLHPNVMREPGSRSLYNPKEKDVVNELVQGWVKQEQNVLVVSPYSAQVTSLMLNLDRSIRVRTIDGCQGVEADVVIVSFVTFNFSDARDFVVDPKRMNVAFSRAREVLYLVGDLDELRHNIGRMPPSNAYHHLVGLAELFGETGHFRECVQRWEP